MKLFVLKIKLSLAESNFKIIISIIFALLYTFNSNAQCLGTEEASKKYFIDRITSLNPIEGIWSSSDEVKKIYFDNRERICPPTPTQRVEIHNNNSAFELCNLTESNNFHKISFEKTAVSNVYLFKVYYPQIPCSVSGNATLTNGGILQFSYYMPTAAYKKAMGEYYEYGNKQFMSHTLVKVFPTEGDFKGTQIASGTGFALTSDGNIVTNYHVVNGASQINIRGVNGDFSRTYTAKVILEDKNNDLAIIKINDDEFRTLGVIPYTISKTVADVGIECFCLGYPLRATLGDEVKLTNGIISSKSGFKGDVTTYQITAPVQPGNSGGPLFDENGNLIGIINAKHLNAENVSYAVKTSYLYNLIESMPIQPKLNKVNGLLNKKLTEQVKAIKNYTYIIEIN
jgi:S1-C subfamily serine protease